MSLHPQSIAPVPELTARIAKAAFPKGNLYMTMRDEFGALFEDEQFGDLFSTRGRPAEAPWRLALVTGRARGRSCRPRSRRAFPPSGRRERKRARAGCRAGPRPAGGGSKEARRYGG